MIPGKKSRRPKPAVLGIFSYPADLRKAVTVLSKMDRELTVLAPSAQESLQEVLERKPSPVRYYTLGGGLLGLVSGLALAVYTALQWKFVVSGKPLVPWIPFVIVGFEFLILFGVLGSFCGWLLHSRLPRLRLPAYYDPRFSDNRFGLLVYADRAEGGKIAALLQEAGAEEVHDLAG
ncbi:MAG: DUF3341 domain-containing protein [Deltaproteobacteria bacterium]|nr:DUF3341 domain-containing protein [Deltaproteobacteria bacterium]